MQGRGNGINLVEVGRLATSQRNRNKALCAGGHRVVQKHQDNYDSTHYIIQAVILYTQHLNQDARGVEKNGHLEEHSKIQDNRILRYSSCIYWLVGQCVWK